MQTKHHPEEFIGKELKVETAKNKSLIGITGKIIDETKKSFVIDANGVEKTLLKEGCTFTINGNPVFGQDILARPEERIKHRR